MKRAWIHLLILLLLPMAALAGNGIRVLAVESPYDMETTVENLKQAIAARQYRVNPNALFEGMDRVENDVYTIYFCSFSTADLALRYSQDIGPIIPCRIVVKRVGSKIMVYAPDLTVLRKVFEVKIPELCELCDKLEADYRAIIEEATL
jgi:uncharacterized protein (DUF302 family)